MCLLSLYTFSITQLHIKFFFTLHIWVLSWFTKLNKIIFISILRSSVIIHELTACHPGVQYRLSHTHSRIRAVIVQHEAPSSHFLHFTDPHQLYFAPHHLLHQFHFLSSYRFYVPCFKSMFTFILV